MGGKFKKLICILCIAVLSIAMCVPAFGYGTVYKFTVKKGEDPQKSGIVYKNDSERASYVTLESAMYSTGDTFLFGARVRNSSGTALTNYYTTNRIGKMGVKNSNGVTNFPFLSGVSAYKGQQCRLHAQVDSSSASNLITAYGVWTP